MVKINDSQTVNFSKHLPFPNTEIVVCFRTDKNFMRKITVPRDKFGFHFLHEWFLVLILAFTLL